MNINIDFSGKLEKIIPPATVIFVAVIFFLLLLSAFSSGRKTAQSKTVIKNAESVSAALEFFYSDQQKYPSVLEFSNKDIMLNYLSAFPEQNFVSELCGANLDYKRPSAGNYELYFCLPKARGGFSAGWNRLVNK